MSSARCRQFSEVFRRLTRQSEQKDSCRNYLFDIDMNLIYEILSIICLNQSPNVLEIVLNTSTATSLFVHFECISTDFLQKLHEGKKDIPLRIQIDTYHKNNLDHIKRLHL